MAVIAVLVAVAIPTFGSQLEKARQATDKANLRDAYAVAKMAILNQDDKDGLKDYSVSTAAYYALANATVNATLEKDQDVYFGFDGDKLTYSATAIAAGSLTSTVTMLGKATTGALAATDSLPVGITYVAATLPTYSSTANQQKGIVVHMVYHKDSKTFTFSGVTFDTNIPAMTAVSG